MTEQAGLAQAGMGQTEPPQCAGAWPGAAPGKVLPGEWAPEKVAVDAVVPQRVTQPNMTPLAGDDAGVPPENPGRTVSAEWWRSANPDRTTTAGPTSQPTQNASPSSRPSPNQHRTTHPGPRTNRATTRRLFAWAGPGLGLGLGLWLALAPPAIPGAPPPERDPVAAEIARLRSDKVALATARERAVLLHDVYAGALDVLHRHYFTKDKSVVPSFVLEDAFGRLRRQWKIEPRWISVNLKPMSLDHEPETDFERRAARELSTGRLAIEEVTPGWYRRAGSISLHGECLTCHGASFVPPGTTPRYAALVLSVPLAD